MRFSILALVAMLITPFAFAHEFKANNLTIDHPYVREMPPRAQVGAGYMTVINDGQEDERLMGIESAVAERTELHQSKTEDGIARMRALEEGLNIPAGQTVKLGDDGTHAMFIKPKSPFKIGESFDGVLIFEKAGRVPVVFKVEGLGAEPAKESGHNGH